MNDTNDNLWYRLSKSKFRSNFILKKKDINYINEKGIQTIENHARDFIIKRLAPAIILNDGKQTPMKGHPVFIAQHATATCCRNCLYKWHNILPNHKLSEEEINYVLKTIMEWINIQMKKN